MVLLPCGQRRGTMEIIDSHQHFWDHKLRDYSHISGNSFYQNNFYPKDLRPLMSKTGVKGTILVQAHPSKEEADWLISIAEDNPFVLGVVAWLDLASKNFKKDLESLEVSKKFKGVRSMLTLEDDDFWVLREDVANGFELLEKKGLTYDFLVEPRHLPAIPKIASAYPKAKFVIDHIAKPLIAAGQREPWGTLMKSIAKNENVYVKISGLVSEDDPENIQVAHSKPFVDEIIRLFGFSRVMYGSDWPVSAAVLPYEQVLKYILECLGQISEGQMSAFLYGNAKEFYNA